MAGYIGNKSAVVSSGAERKKTFAITTTTTSLTGLSYTPNFVHVFHNGIRLVDGTDYTATNGTSITLTNAAENGDEVVVVSYGTFTPADAYTKAEADDRYVNVAGDTMTGGLTVIATDGVALRQTGGGSNQGRMQHDGSNMSIRNLVDGAGLLFYTGQGSGGSGSGFYRFHRAVDNGTALNINSEGQVNLGYQPFSDVQLAGNTTSSGAFSTINVAANQGGHWNSSTHRFTAPVNGYYLMTASAYTNYSNSYGYYCVFINGGNIQTMHWNHNGVTIHTMMGYSRIRYLAAGDYVQFGRPTTNGASYFDVTNFTVQLLG